MSIVFRPFARKQHDIIRLELGKAAGQRGTGGSSAGGSVHSILDVEVNACAIAGRLNLVRIDASLEQQTLEGIGTAGSDRDVGNVCLVIIAVRTITWQPTVSGSHWIVRTGRDRGKRNLASPFAHLHDQRHTGTCGNVSECKLSVRARLRDCDGRNAPRTGAGIAGCPSCKSRQRDCRVHRNIDISIVQGVLPRRIVHNARDAGLRLTVAGCHLTPETMARSASGARTCRTRNRDSCVGVRQVTCVHILSLPDHFGTAGIAGNIAIATN